MKFPKSKTTITLASLACVLVLVFLWWIGWGSWPNSEKKELPWEPDAIVLLGGGNEERPREAYRLHKLYPEVEIVVTGDNSLMFQPLINAGVSEERIRHEQDATSTVENAQFTDPILDELDAKRVVLVTNWFHVPRALAVFRKHQPEREFVAAFEPKPEQFSNWHRYASRRERLAALYYLVRHQIWSF
ncbi:MAG: YdcF family protein [Akkermansiaceae bacterium]